MGAFDSDDAPGEVDKQLAAALTPRLPAIDCPFSAGSVVLTTLSKASLIDSSSPVQTSF